MKKKVLVFSLMILCVCFGFSREEGKFGFLFKTGSINSVGLSINLSDSLTLRPSLGFSSRKSEETGLAQEVNVTKNNYYSANLGLFCHFMKKEHLSVYSGLDFGYSYRKVEGDHVIYGFQTDKIRGSSGNIILGLQYNFNKHLAVFGEIGFGFQRDKKVTDTDAYTVDLITTDWSLNRSGFGIILYL